MKNMKEITRERTKIERKKERKERTQSIIHLRWRTATRATPININSTGSLPPSIPTNPRKGIL